MTISPSHVHPGSREIICILGSLDADGTRWTNELATHFAPMRRAGLIDVRREALSTTGDDLESIGGYALRAAALAIALLTPRALADSRFVERAEEARRRRIPLLPVIVRACDWQHPPFANLLVLPRRHAPVASWRDRGRAWNEVVDAVRQCVPRAAA